MKIVFALLLITTSCFVNSVELEQSVLIQKIQEHAAKVDLHERHFIFATQALSQSQIRFEDTKVAIPQRLFEFTSKNGDFLWKNEIKNDKDKAFTKDELRVKALPSLLKQANDIYVNHANALRISVVDLPRFYQLKNDPQFAELFSSTSNISEHAKLISNITIEMQCSSIKHDCKRELKRSDPEHVAALWKQAAHYDVLDSQRFVLRYINVEGEQIGNQEVWRYHEHFGPRFFEVME